MSRYYIKIRIRKNLSKYYFHIKISKNIFQADIGSAFPSAIVVEHMPNVILLKTQLPIYQVHHHLFNFVYFMSVFPANWYLFLDVNAFAHFDNLLVQVSGTHKEPYAIHHVLVVIAQVPIVAKLSKYFLIKID